MRHNAKEYEKMLDDNPKGFMNHWIRWLVLVSIILVIFFIGFKIFLQPIKVAEKVFDASNMIYNYEYFYSQYHSYKSIEQKIIQQETSLREYEGMLPKDRKEWTWEDKTEWQRLRTLKDGLIFQINDVVEEYNAKSKMWTREIFKSDNLPYQLQIK